MPTIKHENKDALNAILTVEIAKADYLPKVNDKLKEYRKKANIKGFRPGKVPMGLIKSKFGTSVLIDEVNEILGESVNNYINEAKLKTVGQPLPIEDEQINLTIQKPDDYTFEFEMGLAPEFEVEGISLDNQLTFYDIDIDEKYLDEEIESVRNQYGEGFEQDVVEVIESDMLVINLDELEGEALKEDGVKRENTYLALRDVADADLKDNLLTATLEDTFDVNVFKLEDRSEEHIRKHILGLEDETEVNETFRLTIKEIKRVKKAALNEDFFKKIFPSEEIATADDFRNKIKEEIAKSYKQASLSHFTDLVFDELVEKNQLDLPLEFLKKWLKFNNEDLADDYFDGKDFENFQRSLRWNLIREKLAEQYKAEVVMEDIEALVRQEIMQYFQNQIPAYGEMMDGMVQRILSDKNEVRRRFDMLMDQRVLENVSENMGKDVKSISKEAFEDITKTYRAAKMEENKAEEVATEEEEVAAE